MKTGKSSPVNLYQRLLAEADLQGFPLANAIDTDGAPSERDIQAYDQWLANGSAGEMQYLKRGRDRRTDLKLVYPETQSILCVALPYDARAVGSKDTVRYARYLRGRDYHTEIAERLETLMRKIADDFPDLKWKVCVDTSGILERHWAARAGLGWIGKNTMLIHPQYGSYLLLGEVLLNQQVGNEGTTLKDYCGHCTRCVEACPTQAISDNRILESTRCISYWTLEKRGDLALEPKQEKAISNWVAGCDICQEVCPFNTKANVRWEIEAPNEILSKAGAVAATDWDALARETLFEYKIRVRDSSLNRVKPEMFKRNLMIAQKNKAR